jgi:hypothetical protein
MGTPARPKQVKLIAGLLSADRDLLVTAREALSVTYGRTDLESEIIPFTYTSYYNEEMGDGILRQYLSFDALIEPESIGEIKRETNALEQHYAITGKRKVNIDPGYVDLSKMVLATTKDATYRVYLGGGIFAQSTMSYRDKSYEPWPWTYPDYKSVQAIEFFNRVRELYRRCLE